MSESGFDGAPGPRYANDARYGIKQMVETLSKSVVLGVNFIHREHLLTAARVFRDERKDDESFSSCYPDFQMLALNEFMVHLWLLSKIKMIHFCRNKQK